MFTLTTSQALGIEMGQMESIADGLLNFEQSLITRQLNDKIKANPNISFGLFLGLFLGLFFSFSFALSFNARFDFSFNTNFDFRFNTGTHDKHDGSDTDSGQDTQQVNNLAENRVDNLPLAQPLLSTGKTLIGFIHPNITSP